MNRPLDKHISFCLLKGILFQGFCKYTQSRTDRFEAPRGGDQTERERERVALPHRPLQDLREAATDWDLLTAIELPADPATPSRAAANQVCIPPDYWPNGDLQMKRPKENKKPTVS